MYFCSLRLKSPRACSQRPFHIGVTRYLFLSQNYFSQVRGDNLWENRFEKASQRQCNNPAVHFATAVLAWLWDIRDRLERRRE